MGVQVHLRVNLSPSSSDEWPDRMWGDNWQKRPSTLKAMEERTEITIWLPHFQQKYRDPRSGSNCRTVVALFGVLQTWQQLWNSLTWIEYVCAEHLTMKPVVPSTSLLNLIKFLSFFDLSQECRILSKSSEVTAKEVNYSLC